MRTVSRRQFVVGASALLVADTAPVAGQTIQNEDGRVAIIDCAFDTSAYIDRLKNEKNVAAIGRYYAREFQWKGKRIADNNQGKPEWEALQEAKIGIVSVYQYESSDRAKFFRDLKSTARKDRRKPPTTGIAPVECIKDNDKNREVFLDLEAARNQSAKLKQPDSSAIYFGADFNLDPYKWRHERNNDGKLIWRRQSSNGKPIPDSEVTEAVYNYFYTLRCELGDRVGVYGNGYTCALLQKAGLVKYTWVSESRSFEDTAKYLRSGKWHIFQNQIDRFWFPGGGVCRPGYGLSVDTDIQNPDFDSKEIGAWGNLELSRNRANAIYDGRMVAQADILIRKPMSDSSPIIDKQSCKKFDDYGRAMYSKRNLAKLMCNTAPELQNWCLYQDSYVDRNRSVRVIRDHGEWLEIDSDDDGLPDGFVRKHSPAGKPNFVASIKMMPDW